MSAATYFDEWQLSVLKYYNSILRHESIDYVFCPITGLYFPPSYMAVIRLVPSAEESRHIAYQFGELDDEEADKRIIESAGNGIVMYRGIANRFLNGEFMIIPLYNENPHQLHMVLLNRIIEICRIPAFLYRYSDIDWKLLEFKDDCRPDMRCLHWRYIISLERATNRSWFQLQRTPIWKVPGPFMRKGIIRHMDLSEGVRSIPNEAAFANTIWDGVQRGDADFDRRIARTLEESVRGNRSRFEMEVSIPGMQALFVAPGAMPGTISPTGTVPEAA